MSRIRQSLSASRSASRSRADYARAGVVTHSTRASRKNPRCFIEASPIHRSLGLHPLIILAVVRWQCVSSYGDRTLFCDSDGDVHAEDGGGGANKGAPQWQYQLGIPGSARPALSS